MNATLFESETLPRTTPRERSLAVARKRESIRTARLELRQRLGSYAHCRGWADGGKAPRDIARTELSRLLNDITDADYHLRRIDNEFRIKYPRPAHHYLYNIDFSNFLTHGTPSAHAILNYNPSEPRDERGRWTSGGGSSDPEITRALKKMGEYLKTAPLLASDSKQLPPGAIKPTQPQPDMKTWIATEIKNATINGKPLTPQQQKELQTVLHVLLSEVMKPKNNNYDP